MFLLKGLLFFPLLLATYGREKIINTTTNKMNVLEDSIFIPHIPEECASLSICENVPNYPTEFVNAFIMKKLKSKKMFQMEFSSCESNQNNNQTEVVGNAAQLPLCPVIEKEYTPKAAQSDDGKWYFIINKKNVFVQKFIAVYCRTLGECENYIYFLGDYNIGRCLQKKATVKLMAIDHDGLEVEKSFLLPSCCSCVASKMIN